jgi:predicted dinucleotide-binding enzyme
LNKPGVRALCTQIGATAASPGDAAKEGDVVFLASSLPVADNAVKSLGDL